MARVRVAVVQITTHPYLTIGERDFSTEPFMVDGEPILSRLSRTIDVSSIRRECLAKVLL